MVTAADQQAKTAGQRGAQRFYPHRAQTFAGQQADQQRQHPQRQRKKRDIIHGAVVPVQAFHLVGHALHRGKGEAQRQKPRHAAGVRGQPPDHRPRQRKGRDKQHGRHKHHRQAVPLPAEDGRLQGQQKAGNIQPLPAVVKVGVRFQRGLQKPRPVGAVLLHHRMGGAGVDIIVRRRAGKHSHHKHRHQQYQHADAEPPPQPAAGSLILPKFHWVLPAVCGAPYGRPRICSRK